MQALDLIVRYGAVCWEAAPWIIAAAVGAGLWVQWTEHRRFKPWLVAVALVAGLWLAWQKASLLGAAQLM